MDYALLFLYIFRNNILQQYIGVLVDWKCLYEFFVMDLEKVGLLIFLFYLFDGVCCKTIIFFYIYSSNSWDILGHNTDSLAPSRYLFISKWPLWSVFNISGLSVSGMTILSWNQSKLSSSDNSFRLGKCGIIPPPFLCLSI